MKRTLPLILVILVVAGGAFGFVRWRQARNTPALAKYATAQAERGNVVVTVSDNGTILGRQQQDVRPQAAGTVEAVYVKLGDKVKAGQTLAVISNPDLADQISTAEANLAVEQARYTDMKNPASKATQSDINLASQKVDQAKRTLALKQADVENLTVEVPMSGTVTTVNVSTGDSVTTGSTLFTVVDLDHLTMNLSVSQGLLPYVYKDETGTAAFANGARRIGRVTYVNPVGTPKGTYDATYAVTFTVDDPTSDDGVRPGMTGTVSLNHPTQGAIGINGSAAAKSVAVSAKVSGTITALNVTAGDLVTAGQTVVTLSNDSVIASEKQAEIDLASAQANLDNLKNPPSTVSATDLQAEENKLNQMQTSLNALQRQRDDLTLTSPFAGAITAENLNPGDRTSTGGSAAAAFTVTDTTTMVVSIGVDELDVTKIQMGQPATVAVEALSGKTYTGKVTSISPAGVAAQGVTTYPVEVTLDKADGIYTGMTGDVTIMIAQSQNALMVPVEAVKDVRGHSYVRIIDGNGEEQTVEVKAGLADDTNIEIVSGLSDGQTVITGTLSSQNGSGFRIGGMGGFGGRTENPNPSRTTQSSGGR
ncbi:MAG: efflux RND transporter periplasmic adaptor subunit [Bacillota bacterium]